MTKLIRLESGIHVVVADDYNTDTKTHNDKIQEMTFENTGDDCHEKISPLDDISGARPNRLNHDNEFFVFISREKTVFPSRKN